METEQIEKALITLNYFNDLFNISNELKNRIPEKHHEIINDLIIEIENIAEGLMKLENEFYYEFLKNETKDLIIKPYEIEDFYMIENVFNNEPNQLSINDITYLFKLLNKFIKE